MKQGYTIKCRYSETEESDKRKRWARIIMYNGIQISWINRIDHVDYGRFYEVSDFFPSLEKDNPLYKGKAKTFEEACREIEIRFEEYKMKLFSTSITPEYQEFDVPVRYGKSNFELLNESCVPLMNKVRELMNNNLFKVNDIKLVTSGSVKSGDESIESVADDCQENKSVAIKKIGHPVNVDMSLFVAHVPTIERLTIEDIEAKMSFNIELSPIAKGSYRSKSGDIKPGIKINGTFYKPKDD